MSLTLSSLFPDRSKYNGMTGTAEALFLSQALLDAVKDLAQEAEKDIHKLLYELTKLFKIPEYV